MSSTITPSYYIHEAIQQIAITRRQELESSPDVAFELAIAPDGLPVVLHVERAADVRSAVLGALRHPELLSRELERALTDLERATRVHSVTLGLVRASGRIFYETAGSVTSLFGDTLLARVLGAASPMVLPEDKLAAAPTRFANTAMLAIADSDGDDHPVTPPPTIGRDARLWIGITKDARTLATARAFDDVPETMLAKARPLVFESLLGVRSARWHVRPRGALHDHDGPLADEGAYRRALASAGQLAWSMSRHDAATLVAELARAVDRDWHVHGRVHADLKPGNVLLQRAAITAFDALDLSAGAICAGVTEGWAAPEQIFVRPVSPATDVFALGLMAASALSAAVFGEETSVVVPATGPSHHGRRRLRVIKDADVWVDPAIVRLPTEARQAWRSLLAACFAFDPARRPTRGAELAAHIDQLLARWELPGRLPIACGPGRLELLAGSRDPIWTLHDRR